MPDAEIGVDVLPERLGLLQRIARKIDVDEAEPDGGLQRDLDAHERDHERQQPLTCLSQQSAISFRITDH
jgi:hypothetical protein